MKKISLLLILCLAFACKKDNTGGTEPEGDMRESIIKIETDKGVMYMWLYKETKLHRENFLKLATDGYLNGTTFHRAISGFVIQGGDPNSLDSDTTNEGQGGPNYTIPAEILPNLVHVRGAVGAARKSDAQNPNRESNGSQFYITMQNNANASSLDTKYTVFGMIIQGMEVADKIVAVPKNPANGRPYTDIPMTVSIVKKSKEEILAEFGFEVK